MAHRIGSFVLATASRILLIFLSGIGAFIAIGAWQDFMLPGGTSFDIVFNRLAWAIYGALAAGLAMAAALVAWQARRFSLAERVKLSCAAVGVLVASIAILSGAW